MKVYVNDKYEGISSLLASVGGCLIVEEEKSLKLEVKPDDETKKVEQPKIFRLTHGATRCTVKMLQSEIDSIVFRGWMKYEGVDKTPYGIYRTQFLGTLQNLQRRYGVVL